MNLKIKEVQKYYTRIIGIIFTLIILSLILDFYLNGYSAETWHKIFHVLLGIIILSNWNNYKFNKPFCLVNGAFFTFFAAFGFAFPNLEIFNLTDTILHSIVGLSGLILGLFK